MSEEVEIKPREVWVYTEKGTRYEIVLVGELKYGYGNWHKSVTYTCLKTHKFYTRDITTFLEKFDKEPA